jgi:hypothetical protein
VLVNYYLLISCINPEASLRRENPVGRQYQTHAGDWLDADD